MPMDHISDGASELSARSRASRVPPEEGGNAGFEFDANSYEGRGGAMANEVFFVLVIGTAELTSA